MNALSPDAIDALKIRLHSLYADGSKHAVYQNIPEFVRDALGYREPINEEWRSDTPRYQYFADRLPLHNAAEIADVGANTGYFTLNLGRARPDCVVHAFEPNPRHAAFIREIAIAFAMTNVLVRSEPWSTENLGKVGSYEVTFLLNILHHAGFDFDPQLPDRNDAFESYATNYLHRVRQATKRLCFQIGSNRGGDKQRPLFHPNDDAGRMTWCCKMLLKAGWRLRHIGIAGRDVTGRICYTDLPPALLAAAQRNDLQAAVFSGYFSQVNLGQFPGEFYRRPLFVCEAG